MYSDDLVNKCNFVTHEKNCMKVIRFYLDDDIPQSEQDSYDNNPFHICTSV